MRRNGAKKGTDWRERCLKNLSSDIIIYRQIETSLPLAKSLVKKVSHLIKWAKEDTLHSRRLALARLFNKKKEVLKVLFTDLKERYKNVNSGFTRISKLYHRRGDDSLRVTISLV